MTLSESWHFLEYERVRLQLHVKLFGGLFSIAKRAINYPYQTNRAIKANWANLP